MVFSSVLFLFLFLPATLAVYYNPFFKTRRFKNTVLLLASLFFYAWGEPVFVFVMLVSIGVNWAFGLAMVKAGEFNSKPNLDAQSEADADSKSAGKTGDAHNSRAKKILVLTVVWNVALLFVFKYLSFSCGALGTAIPSLDLPVPEIALPIGISFFTFQIMSYIYDVYYKKVSVQKNAADLALYISLFPQLIAGPIVRYETVAHEIRSRTETPGEFTQGFSRFVLGLGKKCLLANYMAVLADTVFASELASLTTADAWIGIAAYTLQIYFDFSGYSDMAIGLGLMFGFHFNENFNYPYAAASVTDFWRRWHISLSSWFRDYVYIPLGGNRCSKARWVFNLFAVWALTGIWHGANWTFWLWGVYYFALLFFEKTTGFAKRLGAFSHVYTLLFVMLGWVLFRSESLVDAALYLHAMFVPKNPGSFFGNYLLQNGALFFLFAAVASLPVAPALKKKLEAFASRSAKTKLAADVLRSVWVLLIFVLSVLSCIKSSYNPFIYFNF